MSDSLSERFWKWWGRLADTAQVIQLIGFGSLIGVATIVAGYLSAPWKVIVPLCVIAVAFIIPGVVCLLLRPRPLSPDEVHEIYLLKQKRLNRVIDHLNYLADNTPFAAYGPVPESWKRWHFDVTESLRKSVKPNIRGAFPAMFSEPNEEMISSMAATLRSIAANLAVDDLLD